MGIRSPYSIPLSPFDPNTLRQLTILELEQATCNFSQNNIIGEGRFGFTYKGLLQDGSIVAVKRRLHSPTQFFFREVYLTFCCNLEQGFQLLISAVLLNFKWSIQIMLNYQAPCKIFANFNHIFSFHAYLIKIIGKEILVVEVKFTRKEISK